MDSKVERARNQQAPARAQQSMHLCHSGKRIKRVLQNLRADDSVEGLCGNIKRPRTQVSHVRRGSGWIDVER